MNARGLYDTHGDKVRYLIVGVWNTAIGYLLFLVLLAVLSSGLRSYGASDVAIVALAGRHYYVVIQWIAWVLAVPHSTMTMKYFAFRTGGRLTHQIPRAYLVYLPAQVLSASLLWLTVEVVHLIPQVGQLLTIIVATVFSYLGHKYFTFKTPLELGDIPPQELLD